MICETAQLFRSGATVIWRAGGRSLRRGPRFDGWGSLKEMIGDLSTGKVVQALCKAPLLALETIHITVPIPNTEKTILVGLNYKFHIAEAGYELPAFPSCSFAPKTRSSQTRSR